MSSVKSPMFLMSEARHYLSQVTRYLKGSKLRGGILEAVAESMVFCHIGIRSFLPLFNQTLPECPVTTFILTQLCNQFFCTDVWRGS